MTAKRPIHNYEVFKDGNDYTYDSKTDEWKVTERIYIWPYIKVTRIPFVDGEIE